jgi:predicted transcriptional regulator
MSDDTNYPVAIDPVGHAAWEFQEAIERLMRRIAEGLHLPYREIMKTLYETQKEAERKITDLVARIDRVRALALACQDPAERMRYAHIKRALEHDLARATGLKDFGFVPREGAR